MMKGIIATCLALLSAVVAVPLGNAQVEFEADTSQLPLLKLDYATYRASGYNRRSDTYIWKNIRFAAPPTGENRWAKPQPPTVQPGIIEKAKGYPCPQSPLVIAALTGSSLRNAASKVSINSMKAAARLSREDCLFLDLYVPGRALKQAQTNTTGLPVVVWIYGGAYVLGSKDVLYSGTELIRTSGQNMVMVVPNYRVGAFGWLAGTTVENQGIVNAGLWDQRAAFEWTKKYIATVGGNPNQVSAWGESAGAGSLMHHLVGGGGTIDPLFNRAILQSPAFHVVWDRRGVAETGYKKFETLAGCAGKGLPCLRNQSYEILQKANEQANVETLPGIFAFGPTPDGSFIRQIPSLELKNGKYWKGLDSLIVSHTSDEGSLFYPRTIKSDAQLSEFILKIFPDSPENRKIYATLDQWYPPITAPNSPFKNEGERVKSVIAESTFTCNARFLAEAYANRTWTMQFSTGNGMHGSDLIATWIRPLLPNGALSERKYQSYLTSHAVTGDPNKMRFQGTTAWPLANPDGQLIANTLDVHKDKFTIIQDPANPKSRCDFWIGEQTSVIKVNGYPEA